MNHMNELVSPRRKANKVCRRNNEDHLSNLPDDVICHILSYLPTIYAFGTSMLSKDWKHKWTSIDTIDIVDEKFHGRPISVEGDANFIRYMNNITTYAKNVRKVSLRLFKEYDLNVVKSWIFALLSNQIEVLYVNTIRNADHVVIPGSLINSTSLIYMVLEGPVFSVPSRTCFANLKTLRLEHLLISNEDSDETLGFHFHVLETFQVSYCNWSGVKTISIRAPALVTFIYETRETRFGDFIFLVHSGNLTKFISRGAEPNNIYMARSRIASASFVHYIYDVDGEPIGQVKASGCPFLVLLEEFSYTLEFLTLSFYAAEAMMKAMKLLQDVRRWPELKRFVLCTTREYNDHITYGNTEVLFDFLLAMPCLECLHLDVTAWNDFDCNAVESLPSCCIHSLEEIVFKLDNDIIINSNPVAQLRLAKFLLKTALKLKKFRVYVYDNKEFEDQIVSKISAFATGSRCVDIVGRNDNNSILYDEDI